MEQEEYSPYYRKLFFFFALMCYATVAGLLVYAQHLCTPTFLWRYNGDMVSCYHISNETFYNGCMLYRHYDLSLDDLLAQARHSADLLFWAPFLYVVGVAFVKMGCLSPEW